VERLMVWTPDCAGGGLTHVFTYLVSRDVPIDFRPFLR
jgi:hypothetical protein